MEQTLDKHSFPIASQPGHLVEIQTGTTYL